MSRLAPPSRKVVVAAIAVGLFLLLAGFLIWPVVKVRAAVNSYVTTSSGADAVIQELGGPEEALSAFRYYLRFPKWAATNKGKVICLFGHCGVSAVTDLLNALHNPDPEFRAHAAQGLAFVPRDGLTCALPYLVDALRDENSQVRMCAAGAIGALGSDAKDAAPHLTKLLNDRDPAVRVSAGLTLAVTGEGAREAVPVLIELLSDKNASIATNAAAALGAFGAKATSAVPALEKTLSTSDDLLRATVVEALRKIRRDVKQ